MTMTWPNQSAAANRRHAGQSNGSGILSATVAADRAFPAAVAEVVRRLLKMREQPRIASVKHFMKRHATFFWIVAAVLGIGASLAWAIPTFAGARLSPRIARPVQLVLLPPQPNLQTLAPGVYQATPHSMLVLVPDDVDPPMVYRPDTSAFRTPIYQPPGHLEKR